MKIAHFLGLSLIDYPGKVAAVIWTVGCNLRCPFCYNPELVLPEHVKRQKLLDPGEILRELAERVGFIEGLAITGGEPTLQGDLADFLREVKNLGLEVKLDTNGTRPEVLEELLSEGLLDYVALDVKAPFERYHEFVGLPREAAREVVETVRRSLEILAEGKIPYELRTTAAPGLSEADIARIKGVIPREARYFIQRFVVPPEKGIVGEEPKGSHLSEEKIRELAAELGCEYRI